MEIRYVFFIILVITNESHSLESSKMEIQNNDGNNYSKIDISNKLSSDAEIFTNVYLLQGNGSGSNFKNTEEYRKFLQSFLDLHSKDIKTIVDLGCGDWQIMSHISFPINSKYLGLDVVDAIIANNKIKFSRPNIDFKLIKDESEIESGDLLILKDVLQHWPNDKVEAFYMNIRNKFRYVLITNCYKNEWYKGAINEETYLGGFRTLDLTKPPFSHSELELVLEYEGGGFKKTFLLDNTSNCEYDSGLRLLGSIINKFLNSFLFWNNSPGESGSEEVLKTVNTVSDIITPDTKVFTNIYSTNYWGNGSGGGSIFKNTEEYRKFIQFFLDTNSEDIKIVVDLGCGDWQIMRHITFPPTTKYYGLDVVESVISANKAEFSKSNIEFKLVKDESEVGSGDLLILKDVLQHWPNDKVAAFYKNVKNKFKYVLITNCYKSEWYNLEINGDTILGGFRTLDLTQPPFNYKELELVLEYTGGGFKKTFLLDNTNNCTVGLGVKFLRSIINKIWHDLW